MVVQQQFSLLTRFFRYLSILYLRLNQALCLWLIELFHSAKSPLTHHILVIGDDVAAGFGDSYTFFTDSGICGRLKALFRSEGKIRQNWNFHNYGSVGTTSRDLQQISRKVLSPSSSTTTMTATRGPIYTFDYIIVCTGSNDDKAGIVAEETVTNIADFYNRHCKNSKIIILSLPQLTPYVPASIIYNQRANKLLSMQIHSSNFLAIDRSSNYRFRGDFLYDLWGERFNSRGYRLLADELFEMIMDDVVKIEFSIFKHKIK